MIKLEDRKNTTKKALEALEALVDSFEFSDDIDRIESLAFNCAGDIGDDTHTVYGDLAFWALDNGELTINGYISDHGSDCYTSLMFRRIRKIDFQTALIALTNLIAEYNTKCAEKDSEIEKFLAFCESYKA